MTDWQVAALITPSRCPLKSVVDSRVNNGTLNQIQQSGISKQTLLKHKQKSKRLSAPLHNLPKLVPALVKELTPSPVTEECLNNDKETIEDLPSYKDKDASEAHLMKKFVERNENEVEQVWS